MNGGDNRGWRGFAAGTMALFFAALFIFAAVADPFLSRFMPIFIGLMLVALLLYTIVVGSVHLIQRARHHGSSGQSAPPSESEAPR